MRVCDMCAGEDVELVEIFASGRRRVVCDACRQSWPDDAVTSASLEHSTQVDRSAEAKRLFPAANDVDPARLARVNHFKQDFLRRKPAPQADVDAYWARYQRVFSQQGLQSCDPQDLKDFANTPTGARPGNMSVFNTAWNTIGADLAAQRTRDAVDYLLYGSQEVPLEDRLTELIEEDGGRGMTGFKEALLTKVLCIVQPGRFLPILTYSSPNVGKKEIAKLVYALDLPAASRVRWTIGRLILWSNDVLLELAGGGFVHAQHISQFLWEAKDRQADLKGTA